MVAMGYAPMNENDAGYSKSLRLEGKPIPDWAVTAAIRANGTQFASVMKGMGSAVSGFASAARTAFERAIPGGRMLSKTFSSMAGQVAIGNLLSRGISRIGREIAQLPKMLVDFAGTTMMIGRTAIQLGMTTDAFQRLSYAAKLTDTPVEAMEMAFKKLNMGMGQLRVGAGPLHALMAKINPALSRQLRIVKDSKGAFLLVADAMSRTKNAQTRAALAQAAFGKSGQEMIPMLLQGRAGLEKLMKEASIYGSVLDDKTIVASEHLEDTLKRLRGMFGSLKDKVLSTLVTAIGPYVDKATEWVRTHEDLIKQKIPEYIDKVVGAAKWLWGAIQKVVDVWNKLNDMANGKLARDILLVYAAWKSVRLAIDLAKAAQIAFGVVSAATGAAGAGGAIAGAAGAGVAETAIGAGAAKWAGRFAGGGAGAAAGVAGAAGVAAGVAVAAGIAVAGYFGVRGWLPLLKDPGAAKRAAQTGERMQGGNFITDILTRAWGFYGKVPGYLRDPFGEGKAPEVAPNANAQGMRWNGHIWVHAEQGTAARVGETSRGAPAILGVAGAQYEGAR